METSPTPPQQLIASRDELSHRLATLGTFGREEVIEQVLACLQFSESQMQTVILAGDPRAGGTQLLNSLARLLHAQRLTSAEAVCRPRAQHMPCVLLEAIIHHLLAAGAGEEPSRYSPALLAQHPWLAGLFPMPDGNAPAFSPPADAGALCEGLETLLLEMARIAPRAVIVHDLHLADDESLAAFYTLQSLPEHGLRLLASVHIEDGMIPARVTGLLTVNTRVISLSPLNHEQVRRFLYEVMPEIARDEVADALYEATEGYPSTIETRLRGWVEAGALTYHDTCWDFDTEKLGAGDAVQLEFTDHRCFIASPFPPILIAPQVGPNDGAESWVVPPARPVASEDVDALITAVLALRIAGVQFNLYPPTSEIVRAAVRAAMEELQRLFSSRPSLIITFDGRTIAIDGQIIPRRDLQVALKDFHRWMSEGNIRAIGITRQVHEYELARFLRALATYAPKETKASLLDHVVLLNLVHIRVLTRSFQPDLVHVHLSPVAAAPLLPEREQAAGTGGEPVMTQASDATDSRQGAMGGEAIPSLIDPSLLDNAAWSRLSEFMQTASSATRRTVIGNLLHWLVEEAHILEQSLSWKIDRLLRERLGKEEDSQVLRDTLLAVAARLKQFMTTGDWEGVYGMLEPCHARWRSASSPEVIRQLGIVLDRASESVVLPGLLEQLSKNPLELERARPLVRLLGERALRPIISALKTAETLQERIGLMQLLREFGREQQSLLIAELHAPNFWYVYRNLLQVLAEIGSEEGLPVIGAHMANKDPRVRMEAVAAAARIARGQAAAYLIQGLEDQNAGVRARTAALISLCPEPSLLEIILRLLHPRLGKKEPDSVQLNACLALGYFPQDIARLTLVQILHPSLFSPHRKSESMRSVAATALAQHLPNSAVETALKRAAADRSALVRQAAQRALTQWQAQQTSERTA